MRKFVYCYELLNVDLLSLLLGFTAFIHIFYFLLYVGKLAISLCLVSPEELLRHKSPVIPTFKNDYVFYHFLFPYASLTHSIVESTVTLF